MEAKGYMGGYHALRSTTVSKLEEAVLVAVTVAVVVPVRTVGTSASVEVTKVASDRRTETIFEKMRLNKTKVDADPVINHSSRIGVFIFKTYDYLSLVLHHYNVNIGLFPQTELQTRNDDDVELRRLHPSADFGNSIEQAP
jgi:hypothetical protein